MKLISFVHVKCEGQNDMHKAKLFSYNVVFEPGANQEVRFIHTYIAQYLLTIKIMNFHS